MKRNSRAGGETLVVEVDGISYTNRRDCRGAEAGARNAGSMLSYGDLTKGGRNRLAIRRGLVYQLNRLILSTIY